MVKSSILDLLTLRCPLDIQVEMSVARYPESGVQKRGPAGDLYLQIVGVCINLDNITTKEGIEKEEKNDTNVVKDKKTDQ